MREKNGADQQEKAREEKRMDRAACESLLAPLIPVAHCTSAAMSVSSVLHFPLLKSMRRVSVLDN